jgi:hypothetical protein
MQEVFTQFGGGDFETGIDRFSALDTETGLRILEQTQGSQQFDSMAEALAAANEQSDPGLAQGLRDMKGQGYTDMGMFNTLINDRNAKRQMLLQEQQLELSKVSTMFDMAGNLVSQGFPMTDIMNMPMMQKLMGDGIKTPAGQQMLGVVSKSLEGMDVQRVQDRAAKLAVQSWTDINAGLTAEGADPRLKQATLDLLSDSPKAEQAQGRIFAAQQIAADPEREAHFLTQATPEQKAVYERVKAANFSVDTGQLVLTNPALLESIDSTLATFSPDYVASLDAGVKREKDEKDALQLVEVSLVGLEEAGLFPEGGAAEFVSTLNPENIGVDNEGKLVLDARGTRELVDRFGNLGGNKEEIVDTLTVLNNSFNRATTDALLVQLIEPHVEGVQGSLKGENLAEALDKLASSNGLLAATDLADENAEINALIADAIVPIPSATETHSIKFNLVPDYGRSFSALADAGILPEEAVQEIVRTSLDLTTFGPDGRPGLFGNEQDRDTNRRKLLQQVATFRKQYWNKDMRQRVATYAKSSDDEPEVKQALERVMQLLDNGFFAAASNLDPQEMYTTIAEAEYENPFFGPSTFSFTTEGPSEEVDLGELDTKEIGSTLAGYSTNVWASVTPFNSNQGILKKPLETYVKDLREAHSAGTAFAETTGPLGNIGSNYTARIKASLKNAESLLAQAEQRVQLSRAIESVLSITQSSNFELKDNIFTSISDSEGGLRLDGAPYKKRYEAQQSAEGAAAVLMEYLDVRLKDHPTLETAEIVHLGNAMVTQRRAVVSLAGKLEESLKDLPDESLKEVWEYTFGYLPTWQPSKTDLIMATLFRSPYAP